MAKMSGPEIKNLARKVISERPSAEIDDPQPGSLVEHMSIRPDTLNGTTGYMAEHRLKSKASKGGDMPGDNSQKHFFAGNDPDALGDHVRTVFGGKRKK